MSIQANTQSILNLTLVALLTMLFLPRTSFSQETGLKPATQQCTYGKAVVDSGLATAWESFRGAALKNDSTALSTMVKFPLLAAGVIDGDPVLQVSSGDFKKFITNFFASDSGQSMTGESLIQYIRLNPCVKDSVLNDLGNSAQVANMVFVKSKGVWHLSQVFSTSD